MSRYIEIVPKEAFGQAGDAVSISANDAERYGPLRRIAYQAQNGHGDWTETVVLTYMDGSTERVRGYVVATGEVEQ